MMEFVLNVAMELLRKYPLCDRCLGRFFAQLGRGLDNAERGRAIKVCLAMELHRKLLEKSVSPRDLVEIAKRCEPLKEVLKVFGVQVPEVEPCYVCGSKIEEMIEKGVDMVLEELRRLGIKRFLVGVVPPRDIDEREREVVKAFGLGYWESVRSELKREIGKRIKERYGYVTDFEDPEATVIVDFNEWRTWVEIPSLLVLGTYWKLGRRISQVPWVEKDGSRRYPLAIEDALQEAAKIARGERSVFHGAGREDVDVRMLGSGRPFVLEVCKPLNRNVDLQTIEEAINKFSPWLAFELEMKVKREVVSNVKASRGYKIYRALVATRDPVKKEDLQKLEEFFSNRVVEQWTPRRVLGRKRDMLRRRKVISIKTLQINGFLFESLIKAEGGLYIKELVSGDEGRTRPSFTEVLGTEAACIELDVLYVQKQI